MQLPASSVQLDLLLSAVGATASYSPHIRKASLHSPPSTCPATRHVNSALTVQVHECSPADGIRTVTYNLNHPAAFANDIIQTEASLTIANI
ncbi:hypothetical protein BDU57DRAFT_518965 [Ampelomyces quisqualis]|uniref:Uncharacterized protein n=1 Tax=Ampelomyces quisqualis TaxID=50730 RepID=A0A6A5QJA6_AMPQU|nr:hypothetical protein BDU57DRAFT_518965 [Ampelomyces quisqualis]